MEQHFDGSVLRERREALGLTPDEVFARVHIPIQYILGLEASDLQNLPPACYTLGFLRSYAGFLRLDPAPLTTAYRAATELPQERVSFSRPSSLYGRFLAGRMSEVVTWAAVCAIVALGWATYTVVVQPQAEPTNNRVEAGTELSAPPTPTELNENGFLLGD